MMEDNITEGRWIKLFKKGLKNFRVCDSFYMSLKMSHSASSILFYISPYISLQVCQIS